jgi:fructose-1,6-bisphosphatase/inositol monophosphatase family enzyme
MSVIAGLEQFDRLLQHEIAELAKDLRHRSLHGIGLEELRVRSDGDVTHRFDFDAEERLLQAFVQSGLPIRFSSEERDDIDFVADPQLLALVDPLDGSSGLARGRPGGSIAVSIVDMATTTPVLSRIAEVFTGVQYSAIDRTARRDGKHIRPSSTKSLQEALVGSYFASGSRLQALCELDVDWTAFGLLLNYGGLVEIARVGSGHCDAYIEIAKGFPAREYAAGLHIARSAGAVASDLRGNPVPISLNRETRVKFIVAATPELHFELLNTLRRLVPNTER